MNLSVKCLLKPTYIIHFFKKYWRDPIGYLPSTFDPVVNKSPNKCLSPRAEENILRKLECLLNNSYGHVRKLFKNKLGRFYERLKDKLAKH